MRHYPFAINAIVILPDHLHMIMTLPENNGNFSLRWNLINGIFSRQLPIMEFISPIQKNRRERGIWQKRFWEHLIRNDLDFEHHVNYIHYNPVRHGYVAHPIDWPYSSVHQFIRNGILLPQWYGGAFSFDRIWGEIKGNVGRSARPTLADSLRIRCSPEPPLPAMIFSALSGFI